MAKTDNTQQNKEENQEINPLTEYSPKDIQEITQYPSLYDIVDMKKIVPEFYSGRDLVGLVIAIHGYEWKDSREFGEFVIAKVQLPASEELVDVAFASIPTKQIFRGLDSVDLQYPFVIAVVQANSSYTFQDAKEFLKKFS